MSIIPLNTPLKALCEDFSYWDSHRVEADQVQSTYIRAAKSGHVDRENLKSKAARIQQCADFLLFEQEINEDGELALAFRKAYFCRVRYCPICQWRRQMKLKAKFLQGLPALKQDYPSHRWVFLTLTVKNCDITELRSTLTMMNRGFDRLTKRRNWPAIGWVKSIEITYNQSNRSAHPHIHALLLVPASYFSGRGYINQDTWAEMWQKCARLDYKPVVHIRACEGSKTQSLESAIVETLKYSVKPSDMVIDAEWFAELNLQTHKARAVSICGVLKRYVRERQIAEELDEEQLDVEPVSNESRTVFGWSGKTYKSRKSPGTGA